jgi:phage regulator Rha-like protein
MDSRALAEKLGIGHKPFMLTLRTYQARFEKYGKLPFQKAASKQSGQHVRFALLNEDQALFAVTLSRNTEQVLDAKQWFI